MATDIKQFTRIRGISDIRRLPRLGKIRLGVKKVSKSGKEYPSEVDYFVVPPEVAAVYGEKPTQLDVMFPTEDEHVIFPQSYKWYVSQGLRCRGDGETAMRRFADLAKGDRTALENGTTHQDNDLVRVACPCPLLESGECGENANLMVLLPKVSLGGVFQITTGSFHNIVRINSCIDYIRAVVGHISLVPLTLTRQAEELQYEGKKAKHYLLQLILNVNLEEAGRLRENARLILQRTERLVLPAPEPEPEPIAPGLAEPVGEPDPVEEWHKSLTASSTLQELKAMWDRLTTKDGFYHTLTSDQKAALSAAKDQRKVALAEPGGKS